MNQKKLLLSILGIGLLIGAFSCRKELSKSHSIPNANLKWAEDYFNNTLLPTEGNQVQFVGKETRLSSIEKLKKEIITKTPLWVRAISGKTALFEYVEIPLVYNKKVTSIIARKGAPKDNEVLQATFDRLIIYKDVKGKISQRIISFVPDRSYLDRHKGDISHNKIGKLDNDFDGFLLYRTWDGKIVDRLRMDHGKARSIGAPKILSSMKSSKFSAMPGTVMAEVCTEYYDVVYSQICHYQNPDDYIPTHCDEPVWVSETWLYTICEEVPDEPDFCSDPVNFSHPSCQPPESPDCAGVPNGSAVMSTCGCIGGTTGIPSCSKDPCNQAKIMNYKSNMASVSTQNNLLDGKSQNKEWGGEVRIDANGNITEVTGAKSNGGSKYTPDFTWNSTAGYTTGFNHTHATTGEYKGYPAPSPDDVWVPALYGMQSTSQVVIAGQQQLYKDNMWVGTRVGGTSYISTVNDWDALQTLLGGTTLAALISDYEQSILDYYNNNIGANDTNASEYAFLKVFEGTVNLLKYNTTSDEYEPYQSTANYKLSKVNCP